MITRTDNVLAIEGSVIFTVTLSPSFYPLKFYPFFPFTFMTKFKRKDIN